LPCDTSTPRGSPDRPGAGSPGARPRRSRRGATVVVLVSSQAVVSSQARKKFPLRRMRMLASPLFWLQAVSVLALVGWKALSSRPVW
jgi:hypothetical protein